MNRLILVGNGFDLAHGLKTSYQDFIFWYLDGCFDSAGKFANGHYFDDDFLHIEVLEHYKLMELVKKSGDKGISRYLYENKILKSYLDFEPTRGYLSTDNMQIYLLTNSVSAHRVSFKSTFFRRLIYTCLDCGWVDIEQEYFQQLKLCRDHDGKFESEKVRLLNREFECLKTMLREYLTFQNDFFKVDSSKGLLKDFIQRFKINDINHDVITSEIVEGQIVSFFRRDLQSGRVCFKF